MKQKLLGTVLVCLMAVAVCSPMSAQQAGAQSTEDKTPPSYDMKAQAILDLQQLQQRFVQLAEATPQEKFSYRPAEGVRSTAEVFLHVAGANYGIMGMMGVTPPSGFDGKTFDKSGADKAKIIAELNKGFEHSIKAIQAMSNADFAKLLPKLGPQANEGDVVYILVTHAHEHLGQSIAYARVNGIEPPWTAAARKKAAQPKSQPED